MHVHCVFAHQLVIPSDHARLALSNAVPPSLPTTKFFERAMLNGGNVELPELNC